MIRREKTPRRNDRCPCGSGKKAKRCCLKVIKVLATVPPHLRETLIVSKILNHKESPKEDSTKDFVHTAIILPPVVEIVENRCDELLSK